MKVNITSRMPVSSSSSSFMVILIMGSLCTLVGLYIAALTFNLLPIKGRLHAPREIVLAAGAVFFLSGLALLQQALQGLSRQKKAKRKKRKAPLSPWVWDYEWHKKGIPARSSGHWLNHIFGLSIMLLF